MAEPLHTPVRHWMEHNKGTTVYLCFAVTLILVLQILELAGVVGG